MRLSTGGSDTAPDTDICYRIEALWMAHHCLTAEDHPSPTSLLSDGTVQSVYVSVYIKCCNLNIVNVIYINI